MNIVDQARIKTAILGEVTLNPPSKKIKNLVGSMKP
jgi:hypothetical protein